MLVTLDEVGLAQLGEATGRTLAVGDVVLLFGPMGAGKTTFTRALARGLAVARPDDVCSPSFTIAMHHLGPVPLMHVDLCRLDPSLGGAEAAFEAVGLDQDAIVDPGHVLVVEWAELWSAIPPVRLEIHLSRSSIATDRRSVQISTIGDGWRPRLQNVRDLVDRLGGAVDG